MLLSGNTLANVCKAPSQIVGTPAFNGTKTPSVLKVRPKGATTDSLENPRKLPALRAEVTGQNVGSDASPLSCFFFRPRKRLEKHRKSTPKPPARYASHYRYTRRQFHPQRSIAVPHWTSSHKWLTFIFTLKSGYTLGSLIKIAHSGSHVETWGFTLISVWNV